MRGNSATPGVTGRAVGRGARFALLTLALSLGGPGLGWRRAGATRPVATVRSYADGHARPRALAVDAAIVPVDTTRLGLAPNRWIHLGRQTTPRL